MRVVVDNGPRQARATPPARRLKRAAPSVSLRSATSADAASLHALISSHLEEGHLLPRRLDELTVHASRFVAAVSTSKGTERIVGCAELAPLSASVAEVRSLVVGRDARGAGLGRRMVDELGRRARREGFVRLCAFAHDPRFFVGLGFSIVPHTWVPEKIARDCASCPLFRSCGQYAMLLELSGSVALNARAAANGSSVRPTLGHRV
ncbi:MAG: GNAT family N-acetyltransferase [Vicinamibacterales bacterium]